MSWEQEEKVAVKREDVLLTAWGLPPIGPPKLFPKSHPKSRLVKCPWKDCRPQKGSLLCS